MNQANGRSGETSGSERLREALVNLLQRSGGYEPAVDDMHVNTIVRYSVRLERMDRFLESPGATAHTYAVITDAQVKLQKCVESALDALGITRRDRLGVAEGESALMEQMKAAIMRWRKKNGKRGAS